MTQVNYTPIKPGRFTTAESKSISNTPNSGELENLKSTAQQMEKVRAVLGNNPILISSGFRGTALNKAVGGSNTSSHSQGQAVDFTCPKFGDVKAVCKALADSSIEYDQIIYEQGSAVFLSLFNSCIHHVFPIPGRLTCQFYL